ncbi:MAG: hypothetical protein WC962_05085 [Phycisphaerae bacterium]
MDTAAMVGLMGLTFFCNKCVEVFYKFSKDGIVSEELKETCKRAISAFKSLKWPREHDIPLDEKVALFNTNEEIESFERTLTSLPDEAEEALDRLIGNLDSIIQDTPLEKKKQVAENLQKFFDTLGDHSFYATKDCLRESPTMMGV